MVGFRQFVRPEITASAIAHLSIVALVLLYTEAHPFSTVPSEPVNVDIVRSDEIDNKPEPTPSPQLPADLSALTKGAEQPNPASAAQQPAPPPAASQSASPPPRQAARANRKEAALPQQPPPAPPASAQPEPQLQAAPPSPTPASQPSPGYALPEPDVTVKYHVMLGLPEALPPSVLSADVGDKTGDGGDAATKADVAGDMVSAFRSRIKQCSKLPPSIAPSENLFIKLRILMRPDGRLAAEPMVKEGSASLKAVDLRDGAIAAVAACQPYTMLPADKYNEWKVIDLTFTPRDFNS